MKAAVVSAAGRAAAGCAAAWFSHATLNRVARDSSSKLIRRTNYRGHQVSMLGGPAVAVAALATISLDPHAEPRMRRAAVLAGSAATLAGLLDDLSGTPGARGFRGHLGALRHGKVTTGTGKLGLIGAGGLMAGWCLEPPVSGPDDARESRRHDFRAIGYRLAAGAVIAAAANMANLLDLRPGRVLKAVIAAAAPIAASGAPGYRVAAITGGCAAGMLPLDLSEEVMLGDTGANCVGALLGVASVSGAKPRTVVGLLSVLAGLTALSERVSFSRVIEANPALNWVDHLGRRPAEDDPSAQAEQAGGVGDA